MAQIDADILLPTARPTLGLKRNLTDTINIPDVIAP